MPAIHANNWFVDYNSLDFDQKRLVNGGVFNAGENIGLINGPAGSGKTIILVNALIQSKKTSIAFVSYTHSLLNLAHQGLPDNIQAMTYFEARRKVLNYDLIVIDEVQDIPLEDLRNLISRSNKVILAGDNFQKIFDSGAKPEELSKLANSNIHRLLKAYRLTPKGFAAASKIFPGALEGVSSSGKSVVPIELYLTDKHVEGYELCYPLATKQIALGRTTAILLPTRAAIVEFANFALRQEGRPEWVVQLTGDQFARENFKSLNQHLRNHQVKLQIVQNKFGDLNDAFANREIVLETYHSAKGLDFEYVFLPNLSVESACKSHLQKSLFYVAITRASGALIITQVKDFVSPYVRLIEEFCDKVDPKRSSLNNEEDEF
jgi:superfamily I DNA/RNA helicase